MPAHSELDAIDHAILDLLRQNSRRTVSDIAARVNLSAAPVKRRIDRLEQLGVIVGYTLVVDEERLGGTVEAFTELRFEGATDFEAMVASVTEFPEVEELFTTAGDPDALARIRVNDIEHLKDVVNGLRRTPHITGTKTLMVLDRWVRRGPTADATGAAGA
jgi:Lrp/AsnC family transcriptional regulator, leucine-responsive regulatory protein